MASVLLIVGVQWLLLWISTVSGYIGANASDGERGQTASVMLDGSTGFQIMANRQPTAGLLSLGPWASRVRRLLR
jgi:hypothetical protein